MSAPPVIIVSNALDDTTRITRGITTDSPAASRKVFLLAAALRMAGVDCRVLSLGRGRSSLSPKCHSSAVTRVNDVPVRYAAFWRFPGLSEFVSLLSPAYWLFRTARRGAPPVTVIFYNRMTAYLPTMMVAVFLGCRRFLDLEDGEIDLGSGGIGNRIRNLIKKGMDALCADGALLACSALERHTTIKRQLCYYGADALSPPARRFDSAAVTVLFGGTVSRDTGAGLLVEAVQRMRADDSSALHEMVIEITGKGDALGDLARLATEPGHPRVVVHGRTSDADYARILNRGDIGLALKPTSGPLAHTTFPSKVIELAAAGLLVVTTDISDVRAVLGDGARYLGDDDPAELAAHLVWAVRQRREAQTMAKAGFAAVSAHCAFPVAGRRVADFLQGEMP